MFAVINYLGRTDLCLICDCKNDKGQSASLGKIKKKKKNNNKTFWATFQVELVKSSPSTSVTYKP